MSPLLLLAAPAPDNREASPIALVLVLILLVALIFLIRSMNKHLRKLPESFPRSEVPASAEGLAASAAAEGRAASAEGRAPSAAPVPETGTGTPVEPEERDAP